MVNKESLRNAHQKEVPCFAIISNSAKAKQEFKDNLKITAQGCLFQNISKDLLKKFRIISTKPIDHKKQLSLNLITFGFKNYNVLGDLLSELVYVYNKIKKIGNAYTDVNNNLVSANNLENIIKNAAVAIQNNSRLQSKIDQNLSGKFLL